MSMCLDKEEKSRKFTNLRVKPATGYYSIFGFFKIKSVTQSNFSVFQTSKNFLLKTGSSFIAPNLTPPPSDLHNI